MDSEGKSKIEGLNENLYSRTRYRDPLDKRSKIGEVEAPEVSENWQTPALDEMLKYERIPSKPSSFMKKVFTFALLFFLAAIGVAGYVFFGGSTFVSSRNVDINVLGPTSVSAGEVLELGVSVSNTNNADLEFANLSIQYPQGSRNAENSSQSLTYTVDNLGVIKAGSEAVKNVKVVILGSTGEVKELKFSIEYKVKGSNATFYKDKIYEITIGDSPITLSVESPGSVASGRDFTTEVSITLNSTEIIRNAVLKAEYPYGYSVISAMPKAALDNNVWSLGDLYPGEKKTISIQGALQGQNEEERTFRFYVGVADGSNVDQNLKIVVISLLNTIAIDRPSISLNIDFNGETSSTYVAPAARQIVTNVLFQNNLRDKLLNPRLEISFSGSALNKSSMMPSNNGIYDSQNSKVVWNIGNTSGIQELSPGEMGQVSLRFASLPAVSLAGVNKDIILKFTMTGIPVSSVGQNLVSVSETRTIRIASQVSLSSKALRTLGPYVNTGPIPPKVGEDTTYTIIFSAGNTQDDLTNAAVTAKLGPNVTWLGAPEVGSESFTHDPQTNLVTWEVGTLSSGSGFSTAPREFAFQVSLKPTLGQIGTNPVLVNSIVLSGQDSLTGETITLSNSPLTTQLSSDPAFVQGDGIVVK